MQRRLAVVVACAACVCALATGGCSFVMTKPVPHLIGDPAAVDCSTSRGPAVVDVFAAIVAISLGSAVALLNQVNDYPDHTVTAAGGLTAGAGVVYGVSAAAGFARTGECRKLRAIVATRAAADAELDRNDGDETHVPSTSIANAHAAKVAAVADTLQQAHLTGSLLGTRDGSEEIAVGQLEIGSTLVPALELSALTTLEIGDRTQGSLGARMAVTPLPHARIRPYLFGVIRYRFDQEWHPGAGLGLRIPLPTRTPLELQLEARWDNFGDYPYAGVGLRYDWSY